eukprot:GSChrysophyteH1.ASY1.ANO1.1264.1 assembled CDS
MASFTIERDLSHVETLVVRVKAGGGIVYDGDMYEFENSSTPDAGIGVFAKRDIHKGELLMEVSFGECLSVEKVMNYPLLAHIFEQQEGLKDFPDEVLALGIMYATVSQDASCGWLDYVKACPSAAEMNSTIYWSDEEMVELQGTMLFHLTGMMNRQITQDWQGVHASLKQVYPDILGETTYELYKWAISLVYSRAVGIHRNGTYMRILVPVLDMANMVTSSDAGETFHYDEKSEAMQLISSRDVRAGEEVYSTVGQYSNAKLAYTYGYVLYSQENRAVDLYPSLPGAGTPHAALKRKLLESQPLTAEQNYDFTGTLRTNWISPALLATVRILQATGDELQAVHMGHPFIYNMVSAANEARTLVSLRELLVSKLDVEKVEDERKRLGGLLLEGVPHSNRAVMALIIQVEEREVVQSCITMLDRCQEKLQELGESYVPLDSRGKPSVQVAD